MPNITEKPIVLTSKGSVRGYVRETVYNDLYYCFERIPYGTPPLGELRFKSPVEVEPWHGILDCNEVAPKAVQFNRFIGQVEGSEDCLYINIYAKQLKSDKPLPVMVYIHGGFFCTGNATRLAWGPDYFMMRNVIFITIGYRLGALGFLSLNNPDLQVPGNAGLKDIVLALKFIKENVHNFNGNSNNITLFGHSSGSVLTHCLMASDKANGLFQKSILMAGTALYMEPLPNINYRMACKLGYTGNNDERNILDYLTQLDSKQLGQYDFCSEEEHHNGHFYSFMPQIEPYETPDMILESSVLSQQRLCWSNQIPIMMGTTSFEGLFSYKQFQNQNLLEIYNEHPEYLMPNDLKKHGTNEEKQQRAKQLLDLNLKGKDISLENIMNMCMFMSYKIYHNMYRVLKARLAYSKAPTYYYRFDFDSPTFNLYRLKLCGPEVRGVCHVDELSYIFYLPQSYKLAIDSAEYQTITRMIDMWTAFAEYSNPNVQSIKPAVWKPVERNGVSMCLNISYSVKFTDWRESTICNKWDEVYQKVKEPLI